MTFVLQKIKQQILSACYRVRFRSALLLVGLVIATVSATANNASKLIIFLFPLAEISQIEENPIPFDKTIKGPFLAHILVICFLR